eukprot:TRINITY_DN42451_c0_g1_i6.p1 TRINITY_DN42451_c0_g1~~TRINITY_DN42451_c0_g1_i6.p1  ORF type:complete len:190 (-),score=20.30 TRINITY_DN42451_c0_g1_i6:181-750(-)
MSVKPGPESGSSSVGLAIGRDEITSRFADLYRKEKPRLRRFFARKIGNRSDADDLAQETLARYFKTAAHENIVTPEAYLTRIATNMLKDRAEHSSTRLALRSVPVDEQLIGTDEIDPLRDLTARENLARWRDILSVLPAATLEIFSLNRIEGYSYRDIASDKGLPLWVVQKHMLKAIRHIAAHQDIEHE